MELGNKLGGLERGWGWEPLHMLTLKQLLFKLLSALCRPQRALTQ